MFEELEVASRKQPHGPSFALVLGGSTDFWNALCRRFK